MCLQIFSELANCYLMCPRSRQLPPRRLLLRSQPIAQHQEIMAHSTPLADARTSASGRVEYAVVARRCCIGALSPPSNRVSPCFTSLPSLSVERDNERALLELHGTPSQNLLFFSSSPYSHINPQFTRQPSLQAFWPSKHVT